MIVRIFVALIALGVVVSTGVSLIRVSEAEPVTQFATSGEGVAVGGYDVVAYFTEGRPVPGKLWITTRWKGATWRFADEASRRAFLMDPRAYAPRFGGFCAWAVSEGFIAVADPQRFDIVDGRLYLQLDEKTQAEWRADPATRIAEAERKWPTVLANWVKQG